MSCTGPALSRLKHLWASDPPAIAGPRAGADEPQPAAEHGRSRRCRGVGGEVPVRFLGRVGVVGHASESATRDDLEEFRASIDA